MHVGDGREMKHAHGMPVGFCLHSASKSRHYLEDAMKQEAIHVRLFDLLPSPMAYYRSLSSNDKDGKSSESQHQAFSSSLCSYENRDSAAPSLLMHCCSIGTNHHISYAVNVGLLRKE